MTLGLLYYFELYEEAVVLARKRRLIGHYLGVAPTLKLNFLVLPCNRICCDWTMKTLEVFQKMTHHNIE